MNLAFVFLLLLGCFYSCSTCDQKNTPIAATEAQTALSQEEAMKRSELISQVHYDLQFDLEKKKEFFQGVSTISFLLNRKSTDEDQNRPIRIDFQEGSIQSIVVNQKKLEDSDYTYKKCKS